MYSRNSLSLRHSLMLVLLNGGGHGQAGSHLSEGATR